MTTAVFDTLKASRNLQAAGFAEAQADAIVQSMAEAFEDAVATKADIAEVKTDLAEVKAELKADIVAVKAELQDKATKTDLAEVKADILKVAIAVVIAIILANATMTIALIRFLD